MKPRALLVSLAKASDQLLLGISPNTTNLTFPAPSGGITLTFPSVTATMVGRDTTDVMSNKTISGAAPTAGVSQIGLGGETAATVGAAGAGAALPATPVGYWIINVAGVARKVPYYNP